jgi:DNA modification methylase
VGDVFEKLAELPNDYFDCVVSSPPYWGLRSYLANDHPDKRLEIGLEPTLGEHLDVMVAVFREVRRVLKPTGTCWINYGDCYATSPNGRSAADTKAAGNDDRTFRDKPFSTIGPIYVPHHRSPDRRGTHSTLRGAPPPGTPGRISAGGLLKAKDLCMIPQRLAIALQEDGWWIRSILPWVKRNGMPESINDRPASSIEYVIFATKSARYAYNADAVRRAASPNTNARVAQDVSAQAGSTRANGGRKTNGAMKAVVRGSGKQDDTAAAAAAAGGSSGRRMAGFNGRWDEQGGRRRPKVADSGSGIKANESYESVMSGAVLHDRNFRNTDLFFDSLSAPFGLITDAEGLPLAIDACPAAFSGAHFATFPAALVEPLMRAGCPSGGRVLDPFGGAGTTAMVAGRAGLDCTLIELNADSAEMAALRIKGASPCSRVDGALKTPSAGPLFDGEAA